ncbi:MAG: class I SAM-dependent methyltransferase [Prevotella sp.]|nr:class I SAM-dependent methyltransferase [Prevotella sp.]
MNKTYGLYKLHSKIDEMSKFLNLNKYIEGEKNSIDQIRSYFKINHWAYRRFHSHEGFMHFRISKNGCMTDEDSYFQPDRVSDYIKSNNTVLELGLGQGANLLYLAHSHPDVRFIGVDLIPREDMEIPKNVTIYKQDYSSIPQIPDNSVDVVYAFETIVHNTDKEKIFREVCRVLKPGGIFMVYDYAINQSLESYDPKTQMAISLISKGGAAALIESLDEWNTHFTNSGLTLESATDYAFEIRPDLKRLERKAAKIMKRPILAKIIFALFHEQFVTNIILGYLGYDANVAGVGSYVEWVVKKP